MVHLLEILFPKTMAMAYSLHDARIKVVLLERQILLHIIKVLYFKDIINYQKHCNDIDTWLLSLEEIKLKPNNKRLKPTQYQEWLFNEPYDDMDTLKSITERALKEYKLLPKLRLPEEVDKLLRIIYPEVCKDLSNNTFESIQNYLPEED